MIPDEEAAKQVEEWLGGTREERPQVKILSRVTLKKFAGDNQDAEPLEVIVTKDDGFDEAAGRNSNATD